MLKEIFAIFAATVTGLGLWVFLVLLKLALVAGFIIAIIWAVVTGLQIVDVLPTPISTLWN